MKIVATSDLHGSFPEIPECDILLIAGDVCPVYDHSIRFQLSWLDTNFRNWLEEIRQTKCTAIVGIAGNHDFVFKRRDQAVGQLGLPWFYLQDSEASFTFGDKSLKIYGLPWISNLSRWAFHDDDYGLDFKFARIPEDANIVLSHRPPFGHCDLTVPKFKFGAYHAGFPGTDDMLNRVKPQALVCGHIHEGYGVSEHPSGARIYNVSHMTENYEPTQPPIELDLERTKTISEQSRTN